MEIIGQSQGQCESNQTYFFGGGDITGFQTVVFSLRLSSVLMLYSICGAKKFQ